MNVVVFGGPSIDAAAGLELLPRASFRGPARCGDIYRAARGGAALVGLVDGYFDHTLSVWHKEILWALSRGVRVYGAASLGALRAAELARYGMVGIGTIYARFAGGELEDDDEVAVVHEPRERGYRAQSEAMVNLRATLDAACASRVLEATEAAELATHLKRLFYPHRDVGALREAAASRLPAARRDGFCAWLDAHGVVNQKRLDALALLSRIAADQASWKNSPAPSSGFHFADTDAWRTLRSKIDREPPEPPPATRLGESRFLQIPQLGELQPDQQSRVLRLACERALGLALANSEGSSPEGPLVQAESERFRRERGLLTPELTAQWLTAQDLDVEGFSRLIHDNVLCRQFTAAVEALIGQQIPAALILLEGFETGSSAPRDTKPR